MEVPRPARPPARSQVEAMKTRAMAREMTNYMRQVNPQLTAALIDERDQVRMWARLLRGPARLIGSGRGAAQGCSVGAQGALPGTALWLQAARLD